MLLVTCEPGVPYFSIETLIVDTEADLGPSVGGNGLRSLRSMIDQPIECMIGKHRVQATLTEFYPANERRALEAGDIIVTVDGKVVSDLHATHRNMAWVSDGRARVEINTYEIEICESASNDWAVERFPPDQKDQQWRTLVCSEKFLRRP
ncbi:MAG TPA: hypothetical protein VLB05_12630 [Dongiaceae bacterium]|nr:hypothetical protein [Dongiaceae bacterium]